MVLWHGGGSLRGSHRSCQKRVISDDFPTISTWINSGQPIKASHFGRPISTCASETDPLPLSGQCLQSNKARMFLQPRFSAQLFAFCRPWFSPDFYCFENRFDSFLDLLSADMLVLLFLLLSTYPARSQRYNGCGFRLSFQGNFSRAGEHGPCIPLLDADGVWGEARRRDCVSSPVKSHFKDANEIQCPSSASEFAGNWLLLPRRNDCNRMCQRNPSYANTLSV